MKNLFSLKHSLEMAAALVAVAALIGVLQTFVIGKHYVIPTMMLVLTVIFGNLSRQGLRGERWAKHVLFWVFLLATCHAVFALFWAKTPGEILGDAFIYVYGAVFVVLAILCWNYAKKNEFLI